ncbi:MAG: hypothetical protein LAT55_13205, partial [Opitutales bacterium]|nr:hypothetical protein [Opitutales bacterium]
ENYALKNPAPDAKNRVWKNFSATRKTRPATRLPAPQPRQEKADAAPRPVFLDFGLCLFPGLEAFVR